MPLCLRFEEENTPYSCAAKERHKKRLLTPPHKVTPYHRSVMTVQQEKAEMSHREKKQVLSQILNQFPLPFQQPNNMADLITLYSRDATGSTKNCSNFSKEDYEKLAEDILENENLNEIQNPPLLRLHIACTLASPLLFVSRILDGGANVNQRNQHGQTPLHLLILSGVNNSSSKEALRCLLCRGASPTCKDSGGDSPLLCVRNLLKEKKYDTATYVAKSLLEAGADVNIVDSMKQNLLSYSLQHVDHSIALTKLLFNYGASVWGLDYPVGEDSSFKWLLKGIMRQRNLDNCSQSLKLIGQLMCNQPSSMEALVLRTMIRHSRYYQIYGPLFLGIQKQLKVYWKEPQSLADLCRTKIRETCNLVDSTTESMSRLNAPPVIKNFILMSDNDPVESTEKLD